MKPPTDVVFLENRPFSLKCGSSENYSSNQAGILSTGSEYKTEPPQTKQENLTNTNNSFLSWFKQVSVVELSSLTGIPQSNWSRWLTGGALISESKLIEITTCLNGQTFSTSEGSNVPKTDCGELLNAIQARRLTQVERGMSRQRRVSRKPKQSTVAAKVAVNAEAV